MAMAECQGCIHFRHLIGSLESFFSVNGNLVWAPNVFRSDKTSTMLNENHTGFRESGTPDCKFTPTIQLVREMGPRYAALLTLHKRKPYPYRSNEMWLKSPTRNNHLNENE